MIYFVLGFVSCFVLFALIAIIDYAIKIRRAKKTIKKTVDGCSDINELMSQLEQVKKIFTYENFNKNEVEKND